MGHISLPINNLPLVLHCTTDRSFAITKAAQNIKAIVDNPQKDKVNVIIDNQGMSFDKNNEGVVEYTYGVLVQASDKSLISEWLKQERIPLPSIGAF